MKGRGRHTWPQWDLKLKHKLFISYIVIIVIPVLIGAVLPFTYTRQMVVQESANSLELSMNQMVESLQNYMLRYNRLANRLVSNYSLMSFLYEDYSSKPQEAFDRSIDLYNTFRDEMRNEEDIINIRIYKRNNTIPVNGTFLLNDLDYKDTEWFAGVQQNKGIGYWKTGVLQRGTLSDIRTISILLPINAPYYAGILEIEMIQDYVFRSINHSNNTAHSLLCILDEKGRIVTQNKEFAGDSRKLIQNVGDELYVQRQDSFTRKVDDENYLVLYKELNFQGWRVVEMVSMQQLYAVTNTIRWITIITAISCIIVFISITIVLSNVLTSRVGKLSSTMRQVQAGNFDVHLEIKGKDELADLTRSFNAMMKSIQYLINEVYKAGVEKKEAELKALQEQINPHFLYNTLSSISWLGVQAHSTKIVDIVEALAAFYRLSLNKGKELIRLQDEFAQARAYVAIQKIRYEDSFDVYFSLDPQVENIPVIKLIIQPFIENAIIHGFDESTQGSIYVTAGRKEERLIIRIIDNGKGMEEKKAQKLLSQTDDTGSGGYGMRNVNTRIRLHYGEAYGVSITSHPGEGTIVEIILPMTSE